MEGVDGDFGGMLQDAELALDDSHAQVLEQVDQAEAQALEQVDQMACEVGAGIDQVVNSQLAALDAAQGEALAGIADAGQRALDALAQQATDVESWLATTDASQWPAVVAELERITEALVVRGGELVVGIEQVGQQGAAVFQAAGEQAAADMATVASDLTAHLDEVVVGFTENLGQMEQTFDQGLLEQVVAFDESWIQEADTRIADLDAARQEAEDSLQSTSDDGIAEIDQKYQDAFDELGSQLSTLRNDLDTRANEIANESFWDRLASGLKNFFLGVLDSLWEFVKVLLIVALVILAVVAIVALVILIGWGAAALGAAAAAVGAFIASIATILTVVGLILTGISIIFAVVGVVSAWMNPNLTSDERWRSTGKGVMDIALEFLPDFGMSLLTKADDVSDTARAINTVARLSDDVDPATVANTVDNVTDLAHSVEGLEDLAGAGETVATHADEVEALLTHGDEIMDAADAIPLGSVDDVPLLPAPDGPVGLLPAPDGPAGLLPAPGGASALDNVDDVVPTGSLDNLDNLDDVEDLVPIGGNLDELDDVVPDGTVSNLDDFPAPSHADDVAPGASHADDVAPGTSHADDVAPGTGAVDESDEFVDLVDPDRRSHILDGDATGGGHRHGTGKPGESEFPAHWSDDEIMHHISDVATDPKAIPGANNSTLMFGRNGQPIRNTYTGIRDGVMIKVVVEPATGRIISGYPIGMVDEFSGMVMPYPKNPDLPNLSALDGPPLLPAPDGPAGLLPAPDGPAGLLPAPSVLDDVPTGAVDDILPGSTPDVPAGGGPSHVPGNTPGGGAHPGPHSDGVGEGTSGGGMMDDLRAGYHGYDPETAPEWLRRYRELARLEAEADNVVMPRLQAAYDLWKGFAASLWQAVAGAGGFGSNLAIFTEGINAWLQDNQTRADEIDAQGPLGQE